ncbi:hypothetical protein [Rhodosalinus sp. FB01]|uniref:hypothetical protein n=1 Tax=Rhodosalinus sp. FB01 TaxID=3239194 RepID=UPI00352519E8
MAADRRLRRVALAGLGGAAGGAGWLLLDVFRDAFAEPRLHLVSVIAAAGWFGLTLLFTGPLGFRRAAAGAAALAVPAAALMWWAALGFVSVPQTLLAGHPLVALGLYGGFGAPVALAGLAAPGGWRDPAAVFDAVWSIAMRTAAAAVFLGLAWAVIGLSDALLGLVGVDAIDRILEIDPVPWIFSGAAIGLGLAVAEDYAALLSPVLVLRLLRLLVPALLPVVAAFVLALPLRGLGLLLGGLSPAPVLMSMAAAGLVLVAGAVDRGPQDEVRGAAMRGATRMLALLLPVLAGAAALSIAQRVGSYGWTPPRVPAAFGAGLLLAWTLSFALAALPGGDWPARLRRAAVVLMPASAVIGALWLTPLVAPERWSAQSQLVRYQQARLPLDEVPLWEMAHEWGKPGARAVAHLSALAEERDGAALRTRLAALEEAEGPRGFARTIERAEAEALAAALAGVMPVLGDAELPQGALAALPSAVLRDWQDACARRDAEGRPGCALLAARLRAGEGPAQVLAFLRSADGPVEVRAYDLHDGGLRPAGAARDLAAGTPAILPADALEALREGRFELVPSGARALSIGGRRLVPDN